MGIASALFISALPTLSPQFPLPHISGISASFRLLNPYPGRRLSPGAVIIIGALFPVFVEDEALHARVKRRPTNVYSPTFPAPGVSRARVDRGIE